MNFTAFHTYTEWMSPHTRGGGFQMTVALYNAFYTVLSTFMLCMYVSHLVPSFHFYAATFFRWTGVYYLVRMGQTLNLGTSSKHSILPQSES